MFKKFLMTIIALQLVLTVSSCEKTTNKADKELLEEYSQKTEELITKYRYGETIEYGVKALYLDEKNKKALMNLSAAYFGLGNLDRSMYYAEKAAGYYPEDPEIIAGLLNTYTAIGNEEKITEYMDKALELNPDNSLILSNLSAYYLNKGDAKKAKDLADKALKINPEDTMALQNLAGAHLQNKEFDKAIEKIKKVEEMGADNYQMYLVAGLAYYYNKDQANANKYLEMAVALNPALAEKVQPYITGK
jgi:Flp pilus assembly protein TadD